MNLFIDYWHVTATQLLHFISHKEGTRHTAHTASFPALQLLMHCI
jgi:hypothetical protein